MRATVHTQRDGRHSAAQEARSAGAAATAMLLRAIKSAGERSRGQRACWREGCFVATAEGIRQLAHAGEAKKQRYSCCAEDVLR